MTLKLNPNDIIVERDYYKGPLYRLVISIGEKGVIAKVSSGFVLSGNNPAKLLRNLTKGSKLKIEHFKIKELEGFGYQKYIEGD